MSRPDKDTYFLNLALAVSLRATCGRRAVGCVLTDGHDRVVATGYNGPAAGLPHCLDVPCEGINLPSGTGLDSCEAVHAEMNALLTCPDCWRLRCCYLTVSPCVSCVKLLLGTSCQRVVFLEEYPQRLARERWLAAGRAWVHLPTQIAQVGHRGPGSPVFTTVAGDR